LQVGREDGKKNSKRAVLWNQIETESFDKLKHELAQELSLFQPDFEKPYILRCDASDFAVGAVLAQIIDGKEQPVVSIQGSWLQVNLTGLRRKRKCMRWWQPFLSDQVSLTFSQFC